MFSYEYLRKLSFPLPSYRTLCEKVKKLHLDPGIQYKILDYMESIACATDQHTYCILVLDEMQILPGVEYDPTLRRFVGTISPEFSQDRFEGLEATHALVYMAKGLAENWKQVIGV